MERTKATGTRAIVVVILILDVGLVLLLPKVLNERAARYGVWYVPFVVEYVAFIVATLVLSVSLLFLREYARRGMILLMLVGLCSDVARVALYHPGWEAYLAMCISGVAYLLIILLLMKSKSKMRSRKKGENGNLS